MGRSWTLTVLLIALFTTLWAAPSRAIDTWEPYPVGLRAAEAYLSRTGIGAGDDALSGYAAVTGVAVGLGVRSHVYGFTGISNSDEHGGGVDFLTLGYFQTAIDTRAMDLDYWLELSAVGEGLSESQRGAGLELNVEGPRAGFIWRGAQHWERDGDDGPIGRRRQYSYGLYAQRGPRAQFLVELVQESHSGFDSVEDGGQLASWAFGFNRLLSETTELILEARAVEPPEGSDLERSWNLTVGWVVVW